MDEDELQGNSGFTEGEGPSRPDFLGCYAHTMDAKGRITIPNAYRAPLGQVFTVGPTRDFKGVALYPEAAFDRILAELSAMNQRKPFVQAYTMQFYKLCYPNMQADAQSRILLPPQVRQRLLGEAKDLQISGGRDHVRIMAADKANAADDAFMTDLDTISERIGDLDLS